MSEDWIFDYSHHSLGLHSHRSCPCDDMALIDGEVFVSANHLFEGSPQIKESLIDKVVCSPACEHSLDNTQYLLSGPRIWGMKSSLNLP